MNRSTTRTPASASELDEANIPSLTIHKSAVVDHQQAQFVLCCHHNQGPLIQVIRSTFHDIPHWHLERVVFPGQRLMFYAPRKAQLQIYNANIAGNLLSDTVPCDRLQVSED